MNRILLLVLLAAASIDMIYAGCTSGACGDDKLKVTASFFAREWMDRNLTDFVYDLTSGPEHVDGSVPFVSDPVQSVANTEEAELNVAVPYKDSPTLININASFSGDEYAVGDARVTAYVRFPGCFRKFKFEGHEIGIGEGMSADWYSGSSVPPYENTTASVYSGEEEVDGEMVSYTLILISQGALAARAVDWDLEVISDSEPPKAGEGSEVSSSGGVGGGYGSSSSAGPTAPSNGGTNSGNVNWSAEDISDAASLDSVQFSLSGTGAGVEIVETSSTVQKQFYVEDMTLVNVTSNSGVLTIAYYNDSQVGAIDGNGFYTFSGSPFKEIIVTQVSGTSATYVTKENGVTTGSWTLGSATGQQVIDNTNGIKKIVTPGTDTNGDRTETREEWYTPTNQLVRKMVDTYHTFSVDEDDDSGTPDVTWERLIRSVDDPDGAALTTTYTYEDDPLAYDNYKGAIAIRYPDGGWVYRDAGQTWKPFKDGPSGTTPPSTAPAWNASGYTYESAGLKYIEGNLVSSSSPEPTQTEDQTFDGLTTLTKVTNDQFYATGGSDKLTSATYYYSYDETPEYLQGKLYARVSPDGTCTKYQYAMGTYSSGTFTAGAGADLRTVASQGYVATGAVAYVTSKSTSSESIENERGQTLQERDLLWNGSDFSTVLKTVRHTYDAKGNLTESKRLTAADSNWITTFAAVYNVQGDMTSSTDEYGVISITTTAGRTTTTTTNDGQITHTSSTTVDVAGRVISETSDGLTTTYAYGTISAGGKKVTATLPSGATTITEYYLDGQVKSVSGTGTVAQTYDYGAAAGERTSTVTTEGRAVVTTTDMMGRTKQVTQPKFGGGTSTTVAAYNVTTGQLTSRTTDSGAIVAPQAYTYDSLGNVTLSGYDMDGGGLSTSPSSPDRVMSSEQSYAQSGGNWYAVSKSGQYLPTGLQILQESRNRVDGRESVMISGDRTVTTSTTVDSGDSSKVIVATTDSDIGAPAKQVYKRYQTLLETREPWQTGTNDKTTFTYTGVRLTKTTDALGRETIFSYVPSGSGVGQEATRTMPGGATITKTYTPLGLVDTETGTATYWKKYGYNALGEMTTLTTQGAAGQATTIWLRDSGTGLVSRKTDAAGKYVTYTYNAVGWPTTRTWARGITTTYGYTAAGEVNSISYSDGTTGASSMTYDKGGRLTDVTDASGIRAITYSGFGQRANETYSGTGILSGFAVTRGYSNQRRTSLAATGPSSFSYPSLAYVYNGGTRVTTMTQGSLTTTYTPQAGMLQPATVDSAWSGGVTLNRSYGYDVLGRVTRVGGVVGSTTVSASGTSASPITYDTAGRRTDIVREDGSKWHYDYNTRNEVVGGSKKFSDNVFVPGHQFTYDYDGIGNRVTAARGGNEAGTGLFPISYTPNLLNQYSGYTNPRLQWVTGEASTSASVSVNDTAAWRHSAFFAKEIDLENTSGPVSKNVTVKANMAPSGGSMVSASHTGRLTAGPTGVTPAYDDDGNLENDGLWAYTWDGENRLKSVESVSSLPVTDRRRQEYDYDFEGRLVRVSKFTHSGSAWVADSANSKRLLYDGWNVVAEILGSSTKKYVWGMDISGTLDGAGGVGGILAINDSLSASTSFFSYDASGNVSSLADSNTGVIVAKYGYGPFGEAVQTEGALAMINSIRWSSKITDNDTNLAYYGYRFYSPLLGRWLNRDPLGEKGGTNVYSFCANNPILWTDRLGLSAVAFLGFEDARFHYSSMNSASPFVRIDGFWKIIMMENESIKNRLVNTSYPELTRAILSGKKPSAGHVINNGGFKVGGGLVTVREGLLNLVIGDTTHSFKGRYKLEGACKVKFYQQVHLISDRADKNMNGKKGDFDANLGPLQLMGEFGLPSPLLLGRFQYFDIRIYWHAPDVIMKLGANGIENESNEWPYNN